MRRTTDRPFCHPQGGKIPLQNESSGHPPAAFAAAAVVVCRQRGIVQSHRMSRGDQRERDRAKAQAKLAQKQKANGKVCCGCVSTVAEQNGDFDGLLHYLPMCCSVRIGEVTSITPCESVRVRFDLPSR